VRLPQVRGVVLTMELEKKIKIQQRGLDRFCVVHVVQFEMPMIDYDTEDHAVHIENMIRSEFRHRFPDSILEPWVQVIRP
jgi:hypothetical protein